MLGTDDSEGCPSAGHISVNELSRTQRPTDPIVDGLVREAVLQIEWIHDHGLRQLEPVSNPEEGAIEVHEHPLVWIHVEGGGELQAEVRTGVMPPDIRTSTPFIKYWNSGQMKELPAYAASTCSQTPCSSQTGPISEI